jgi:ubiquinol-cytochrome c reductase iron-sulfur subunit
MDSLMIDSVNLGRRRLLTTATAGTAAVGFAFAAGPFLASWKPNARAKSLGNPVEVDVGKLEVGQMLKVLWRGQAVYVVRRTAVIIDQLGNHDQLLLDPHSNDSTQPDYIKSRGAARARNPEYWIGSAVCTHAGCSPLGAPQANNAYQLAGVDLGENWPGGFYCACHGSRYDLSGRVFKHMPAPRNLPIPDYAFINPTRVLIGAATVPKAVV